MSARDELSDELWKHNYEDFTMAHDGRESSRCQCGAPVYPLKSLQQHRADVVLAAGYRKPRTITTAEELDKLRFQSVVLDAYGTPYVCERHRTDGTRNEWKPSGMDHLDESDTILDHGPVTVVHEPAAAS